MLVDSRGCSTALADSWSWHKRCNWTRIWTRARPSYSDAPAGDAQPTRGCRQVCTALPESTCLIGAIGVYWLTACVYTNASGISSNALNMFIADFTHVHITSVHQLLLQIVFFKNAVNAFTQLDRLETELKNLSLIQNADKVAQIERQAQEVALPPIRQGHQILERAGDKGSEGIRQCVCPNLRI